MNLEELKTLLESGAITQEQFDSMVSALNLGGDPEPSPKDPEPIDYDKIEKLIQARVDKQLASERKKTVDLKKQLERLQKDKLTDDEIKKLELEEKENTIAEREKAISEKENRFYAIKAIKSAGLDDGSDTSLALIDFVMGADTSEIDKKIKSFKELFEKAVNAEVEKRFGAGGGTPKKGSNLNNGVNPYAKEQYNLTEQMKLEISNPELAEKLKATAGVK